MQNNKKTKFIKGIIKGKNAHINSLKLFFFLILNSGNSLLNLLAVAFEINNKTIIQIAILIK